MPAGPQTRNIIFVPVPVGAGPAWLQERKPPAYRHHHVEHWRDRKDIPTSDRIARREQARRFLESTRVERERMCETARAAMALVRPAA
jgi:hypothetical protein